MLRLSTTSFGGLLALLLTACEPTLVAPPRTELQSLELAAYGLFDLGITDADGDGRLDLYTVNHSARQSLALNRGGRMFRDVFQDWRLDQDPRFPGFHVGGEPPVRDVPGVYVYWVGSWLHLEAHELPAGAYPVEGSIEVLSRVQVRAVGGAQVATESALRPRGWLHSRVRFRLMGPGDGVAVAPRRHAQPIEIRVDQDPARIFVGMRRVSPQQSRFSVFLRDRHGMAWNDVDGDGRPELFVTRGGLRAAMARHPLRFWDELFDPGPSGIRETGRESGLEKFGCPGRQAAWVDYDGDGDADLYVACGRGLHARDPNRLYRREPDGRFREVGGAEGVAFPTAGHFAWVDLWGDPRPELLWADRDGLHVCTRRGGRFACRSLGGAVGRVPRAVRVTDVDGDADFDVLVVSEGGNRLFLGDGGRAAFEPVPPQRLGLPARSLAAVWADRDHDGYDELYSVPDGIYVRERDPARYRRVARFGPDTGRWSPWVVRDARIGWADLDGDGALDGVFAFDLRPGRSWWARRLAAWSGYSGGGQEALAGMWVTTVAWGRPAEGHWLALDVEGPPGDGAASGARVRLWSGRGQWLRHVGHAEGAHYSSGHYRVYFGLGAAERVDRLEITWPDGAACVLEGLAPDRTLRVRYPSPDRRCRWQVIEDAAGRGP